MEEILCRLGNARDDFDLEIEPGKPVYAQRGPVGIGWSAEDLILDSHDRFELVLGVGMERGHIDYIVEGAARRIQRRP